MEKFNEEILFQMQKHRINSLLLIIIIEQSLDL